MSLLLLSGCGGQGTEPVGKAEAETPQVEQLDTAPVEADTPDASGETGPSFDNGWASNDFEMQLPEPTFEVWEVSQYVEGSSWRVDANRAEYGAVKAYADALRGAGFSNAVDENDGFDGLAYIFKADNDAGYHVELIFEADNQQGLGHAALELTKTASSAPATAPVSGNGELPELPAVEWESDTYEIGSTSWTEYFTFELELEDVLDYVERLKAAGYDLGAEEYPDGNDDADVYAYEAISAADVTVNVRVSAEGELAVTIVSIGIPK